MDYPNCTRDGCANTIFEVKSLSSGVQKWVPHKTMPVASVRKALQNFMKRPGKWEELQHWRKEDDHRPAQPISCEEWLAGLDPLVPLEDIHDGWRWRSYLTVFQ